MIIVIQALANQRLQNVCIIKNEANNYIKNFNINNEK
jgi:hypothetical protein